MNIEIIPKNNLPIFLQKYSVDIFKVNIPPCLIGGCAGTQVGCCPDGITQKTSPDDPCINDCSKTELGCCPFSTEAKKDFEGKTCKEYAGTILYTTVGAIPSNLVGDRVWELNSTGYLEPNVEKYYIVYDFSRVDYKYKDDITFENVVSGVFIVCGQILDASKIITKEYCDIKSTLTIIIDTSKWDFRLKKKSLFSYQLNVDDDSTCLACTYGSDVTSSNPALKLVNSNFVCPIVNTSNSGKRIFKQYKKTDKCADKFAEDQFCCTRTSEEPTQYFNIGKKQGDEKGFFNVINYDSISGDSNLGSACSLRQKPEGETFLCRAGVTSVQPKKGIGLIVDLPEGVTIKGTFKNEGKRGIYFVYDNDEYEKKKIVMGKNDLTPIEIDSNDTNKSINNTIDVKMLASFADDPIPVDTNDTNVPLNSEGYFPYAPIVLFANTGDTADEIIEGETKKNE